MKLRSIPTLSSILILALIVLSAEAPAQSRPDADSARTPDPSRLDPPGTFPLVTAAPARSYTPPPRPVRPPTAPSAVTNDSLARWFSTEWDGGDEHSAVRHASMTEAVDAVVQPDSAPVPPGYVAPAPERGADDAEEAARFRRAFSNDAGNIRIGTDLYSPPDFEGGLIVFGRDVAMKIGGFVKADFIYDFNPIGSTDSFDTTTIPVRAPPRTNARFHARQSRMSFDTRWDAGRDTVRIYVEGDFFSDGDRFRLRHAYGEYGSILVGQTWTTFTDVAAAPATLDFEGSVSSVNRRQAQARWTGTLWHEGLTVAVAVEDTRFIVEPPIGVTGDPRSPSPDFVAHVRLNRPWGQFQIANLYRIGGFQPTGGDVITANAWGFNFTGVVLVTTSDKVYYQLLFGDGIGSYRGLPDAAPVSATTSEPLGMFGWMVGLTHDWTDILSSNFTYAENSLDNTPFQDPDNVHRTTYLAANLIWSPVERMSVGVEYLYGVRENVDGAAGSANRVQASFIFDLP